MPNTPIVSSQKTAFLALVNTAPVPGGPFEVSVLTTIMNYYSDIPQAISRQIELFSENNAYLTEAMNCFAANDNDLQAAGIYVNKTGVNLTDPVMIINSTYTGIITFDTNSTGVSLLGNSTVKRIAINTYIDLNNIYVGPGCSINLVDASASSAFINSIWLPFLRNTPSTLNEAVYNSSIGQVAVSPGSYYGGIANADPQASCTQAVTSPLATNITHDSIALQWTPPTSGYLFIDVYLKKANSAVWLGTDDIKGGFINTNGYYSGFLFMCLEPDTYYNFKVTTTCNNGGQFSVIINAKTTCCGSGLPNQIVVDPNGNVDCLFHVEIKNSPNANDILTLCSGFQIPEEYPAGATLTIPYLAGKYVNVDLIIDNNIYQNFPYNPATGTFNAAATPLAEFVDGNIISIRAALPLGGIVDCLFHVEIKASPNPADLITLCNSFVIAEEYPTGATLTIPYLIGKNVCSDLIIDNAVYQNFPFDSTTGTFTATGTPVGQFVDGNVISIRADLPM